MRKRPKIWYDYGKYLLRSISFDRKGYSTLLMHLHDITFEWSDEVALDENLAIDGVYQRYYFFKSIGLKETDFDYSCSVLEMLVGFASRIGTEWLGYDESDMEDHIDRIFWMFITNLGLDKYTDDVFNLRKVDDILNIWMKRYYKDDGRGSIFKLKKQINGYHLMKLWTQLNYFIDQFNIKSTKDLDIFD